MTLVELKEAMGSALQRARDIADAAGKESRDFTGEERAKVQTAIEEAKGFKEKIKEAEGDQALKDAIDAIGEGVDLLPASNGNGTKAKAGKGGTLGERFVGSSEFKAFMGQFPGGRIPDSAKGITSPPVGFKGISEILAYGRKALITGLSDTSAGAIVFPDELGLRDFGGALQRPLTIRDLVTGGTTGTDTINYVRVTGFTNAAAPVAEATATTGTSGTKPESALVLAQVSTTVKTIAHWIPATKRALSDAGQIRTLIDNFLRYGLEEELEDQMMSGDGTGENFTGILNISGTQAQAWDTNILTTTRRARTKVRTVGRAVPQAYVLNPSDWETIDLLQDNEARYFFGGPAAIGQPRLWGLPVVESEAIPAGTGLVGDFRTLVLWDREEANIQVSDSHSDFFVRNMVAILAELRAAFGAIRPSAIVEIDLTA